MFNHERVEENLKGRSSQDLVNINRRMSVTAVIKAVVLVLDGKLSSQRAIKLRAGMANVAEARVSLVNELADRKTTSTGVQQ